MVNLGGFKTRTLADGWTVFIGRLREVFFACQQFAVRAQGLEIDHVGVVGAQDFTGGLRQIQLHMLVPHDDELCQRLYVVLQRPVERFAGNALRHQPGQAQADWPQQQQRCQHPVQDFAEQRALFAPEELHGYCRCRLTPRFFPGNSPGRARWQCG